MYEKVHFRAAERAMLAVSPYFQSVMLSYAKLTVSWLQLHI